MRWLWEWDGGETYLVWEGEVIRWFGEIRLRGDAQPSSTVYMSSSICCLASLQMYDQYFLASSMDGSIKLYDHRLTKRGPVQSYEGQVNSHSHIQLAADASERFLLSGEMLFEEKLSSSIPMSVCWQGNAETTCKWRSSEEWRDPQSHGLAAWLGSSEGLLRMQFCL
ncbi:DDB1- and CUL4-associated factor 4 [Bienertia sinuspersici]